jgi:hypothetical protein
MKKPYQIEAQRAVKHLEAMAEDGNPAVQMVLPMAELVGWLRKGVGALIRRAGLQLMDLMMQEEVRELAWGAQRNLTSIRRLAAAIVPPCLSILILPLPVARGASSRCRRSLCRSARSANASL